MKIQSFLFHIPGTINFFDYSEIQKMEALPVTIEVRDCKANTSLGKMNVLDALEKFSQ